MMILKVHQLAPCYFQPHQSPVLLLSVLWPYWIFQDLLICSCVFLYTPHHLPHQRSYTCHFLYGANSHLICHVMNLFLWEAFMSSLDCVKCSCYVLQEFSAVYFWTLQTWNPFLFSSWRYLFIFAIMLWLVFPVQHWKEIAIMDFSILPLTSGRESIQYFTIRNYLWKHIHQDISFQMFHSQQPSWEWC